MELTELSTVAGPVVGLIGVAVAVWALVYSRQSRNLAAKSSEDSAKAVGLAEKSNEIAADAKGVAEEANTISRRAEDRETERHDVEWAHVNIEPGIYELRNDGTDTAHHVRVRFYVDEWSAVGERAVVAHGESVRVELAEVADEFEREMVEVRAERRKEARTAQLRKQDPYMTNWVQDLSGFAAYNPLQYQHNVGYRAVWQTALGSQRTDDPKSWLEELADHDEYD